MQALRYLNLNRPTGMQSSKYETLNIVNRVFVSLKWYAALHYNICNINVKLTLVEFERFICEIWFYEGFMAYISEK